MTAKDIRQEDHHSVDLVYLPSTEVPSTYTDSAVVWQSHEAQYMILTGSRA